MRVYNFSGGIWWNLYWQCCHPSTICRRASAGWGSIKVFNRLVEIWLRCSLWEENWGIFGELTTFNSICGESKTSYKTFPENWQHPAQPLQDLSRKQQKHFTVGQGWQDINGKQSEPLNSNIGNIFLQFRYIVRKLGHIVICFARVLQGLHFERRWIPNNQSLWVCSFLET